MPEHDGSSPAPAIDALLPALYEELRHLAERELRRERANLTLQTTALVHEAYLRMRLDRQLGEDDRYRFLALAARTIRRVLVDHARRRDAEARGGNWRRVEIDDALAEAPGVPRDVLAIDSALEKLALAYERPARVVELRFFAGLDIAETARVLGVSPRTVDGDWSLARAWLARELEPRSEA